MGRFLAKTIYYICLLFYMNMKKYIVVILLGLLFVIGGNAQKTKSGYGFKFKKGYYYLLNKKGKVVRTVEPFTFAESFNEGLALVEKNLKFGYVDISGKLVIDFKFDDAGAFRNGRTYAAIDGKYGYIDKYGKFTISPQFEYAFPFKKDTARVMKINTDTIKYGSIKYLTGLINENGEVIGGSFFSNITKENNKKDLTFAVKDSLFKMREDSSIKFDTLQEKEKPIFYIVEEMPMFPGGQEGLINFIRENVRYPLSAQENSIQAKVYVSFIINTDGSVIDVKPMEQFPPIIKEGKTMKPSMAIPLCDYPPILIKEAVRCVSSMPKWKPGKQRGKAVKVSYIVPINFVLN